MAKKVFKCKWSVEDDEFDEWINVEWAGNIYSVAGMCPQEFKHALLLLGYSKTDVAAIKASKKFKIVTTSDEDGACQLESSGYDFYITNPTTRRSRWYNLEGDIRNALYAAHTDNPFTFDIEWKV